MACNGHLMRQIEQAFFPCIHFLQQDNMQQAIAIAQERPLACWLDKLPSDQGRACAVQQAPISCASNGTCSLSKLRKSFACQSLLSLALKLGLQAADCVNSGVQISCTTLIAECWRSVSQIWLRDLQSQHDSSHHDSWG